MTLKNEWCKTFTNTCINLVHISQSREMQYWQVDQVPGREIMSKSGYS